MTSAVHDYTYSVHVKSRFDLFANDDFNKEDPDLLLQKLRSQKSDRKSSDKDVAVEKSDKDAAEPSQKEGRNDRRGGQKGTPRDAPTKEQSVNVPRGKNGHTRNKITKSGNQREFDRHSGSDRTGVKPVMKKGGHGTANWGTVEDDLEAQTAEVVPDPTLEEEVPVAEEEKAVESGAVEQQEPVEEAPKTLTLKEYREQLKASKPTIELATKGTRPPNDGKNVFSDMVEVHKSKPLDTKVEVVLDDKPVVEEERERPVVVFEFGRGRPGPRGGRQSEFRGRVGAPRFEQRESLPQETVAEEEAPAVQEQAPEKADTPRPRVDRPTQRGGRGGERIFRGRGRGYVPRGNFSSERGGRGKVVAERGGGPGGDRGRGLGERGRGFGDRGRGFGDRGHGFGERSRGRGRGGADRPFRGGDRGGGFRGAGRGGENARGSGGMGPRGRGRGGFDSQRRPFEGSRGGFRGTAPPQNTAPSMDNEEDFPALK